MKYFNEMALKGEFTENKIPKYLQDILLNHLSISNGELSNSYILYNSKHATSETIHWRYEQLKKWVLKHGGIFIENKYDWNKEKILGINKTYEVRFYFPVFNPFKAMFSYLEYYRC